MIQPDVRETTRRPLLAIERQREILNLLSERGSVRVTELAEAFRVTEETIRRDLDKLEQEGRVVRSHGGAVLADVKDVPHGLRELANVPQKEAIAREAARLVEPGDTILLDASSTAWFLARRLPNVPLTVITHSLASALALSERDQIRVISPGGTLAAVTMSFVGSESLAALRRFHARWLFMSCRAFDPARGAFDANEEQAVIRRTMMEIADERVLMVDGSKLGKRALSFIAGPNDFDRVIVDSGTDGRWLQALQGAGIRLMVAEVGS
ncbi:MAG: DeoR/GlpR family DNA-binding transcription regulator [Kiritimatiellae bacterium]|nr:DeoR/GlpR family DNA-binding transcription regulator [Kiritimatiellia bacterium]MDW8459347.1 DeoR/GlpR family DNA-binding transcription regulator [Verrucomicrobiota bacterium]